MTQRNTGGGNATLSGTTFQENVGLFFAVAILSESNLLRWAQLGNSKYIALFAETSNPIDDLKVQLNNNRNIFIQAKNTISLSAKDNSEFANVIKQMFCQYRTTGNNDYFLLATSSNSPRTIIRDLKTILNKIRNIDNANDIENIINDSNQNEKTAFTTIKKHIDIFNSRNNTNVPVYEILKCVYIESFDFEVDTLRVIDAITSSFIVSNPNETTSAHTALICCVRNLAPNRTGYDLKHFRMYLRNIPITLKNEISYQKNIENLIEYSSNIITTLDGADKISYLGNEYHIERENEPIGLPLTNDIIIVGEPGAGKTAILYNISKNIPLKNKIFIPVEQLNDVNNNYGNIGRILQAWVDFDNSNNGYLFLDAVDAARTGIGIAKICGFMKNIKMLAPQWKIITSVRTYDYQKSSHLRELSSGWQVISLGNLSDSEMGQLQIDILSTARRKEKLWLLLKNPFNLNIFLNCRLEDNEYGTLNNQCELLKKYWEQRVSDDRAAEKTLECKIEELISKRTMQMLRSEWEEKQNIEALQHLLTNGILKEYTRSNCSSGAALVGFLHNIMFDFAVAYAWINQFADNRLDYLSASQNVDLSAYIHPSIQMAFQMLIQDSIENFWNIAIKYHSKDGISKLNKIIPAQIVALKFSSVDDYFILLNRIENNDVNAIKFMQEILNVIIMKYRQDADINLLLNKLDLLVKLNGITDDFIPQVNEILYLFSPPARGKLLADIAPEYLPKLNQLSIHICEYGLTKNNANEIWSPLYIICLTIQENEKKSLELIAKCMDVQHQDIYHEILRPLSEFCNVIYRFDKDLSLRLIRLLFDLSDVQDDNRLPFGGSQVVAMNATRRDLLAILSYNIQQRLPHWIKQDNLMGLDFIQAILQSKVNYETTSCDFRLDEHSTKCIFDGSHMWVISEYVKNESWYIATDAITEIFENPPNDIWENFIPKLQYAYLWRKLIEFIIEKNTSWTKNIFDMVIIPEILQCHELEYPISELLKHNFQHFSQDQREGIQLAINGLSNSANRKTLLFVLFKTNRDLMIENLRDEVSTYTESHEIQPFPFIQVTSGTAQSPNDSPVDIFIDKIGKYNNNATAGLLEIKNYLINKVFNTLAIKERQAIADWCAQVTEKDNSIWQNEDVKNQIKDYLLLLSNDELPIYNHESDKKWNSATSAMYGPAPRISAADALMNFAHNDWLDNDTHDKVLHLASDSAPAVRCQIISKANAAIYKNYDLMLSIFDRFINEEICNFLLVLTFQGLLSINEAQQKDQAIANLLERICTKAIESTDSAIKPQLIYFLLRRSLCGDFAKKCVLENMVALPLNHKRECKELIYLSRECFLGSDNDFSRTSRQLISKLLNELAEMSIKELDDAIAEKRQDDSRSCVEMIDSIIQQIYFGLNIIDNQDQYGNSRPVEYPKHINIIYEDIQQLITTLSNALTAHSSYYLIQILEYFVPIDPKACFLNLAKLIESCNKTYAPTDSLVANKAIAMVEIYFSDYRDILKEKEMTVAAIKIIDIFIAYKWPKAYNLAYCFEEVFK